MARTVSKSFSLSSYSQKSQFSRFDVFPVWSPHIFQVQVKIPTMRPVLPHYLSVSYGCGMIHGKLPCGSNLLVIFYCRNKLKENSNPANTQCCDNVAATLQHRTTNTQIFRDVDATMPKLQCCSNFDSIWDSKFKSWCTINVVLTTLL